MAATVFPSCELFFYAFWTCFALCDHIHSHRRSAQMPSNRQPHSHSTQPINQPFLTFLCSYSETPMRSSSYTLANQITGKQAAPSPPPSMSPSKAGTIKSSPTRAVYNPTPQNLSRQEASTSSCSVKTFPDKVVSRSSPSPTGSAKTSPAHSSSSERQQ